MPDILFIGLQDEDSIASFAIDAASGRLIPQADLSVAGGPSVLALGPEGGFEPEERDAFEDAGWRGASLGSNVLRFETAAIAALALTRALLKTT